MRAITALIAALVLARGTAAQKSVSFPTEDGGEIYADVYGEGGRAIVLARGGRFNKKVGRSKLAHSSRQDFEC
jgi:hypothetical protein